MSRYYPLFLDIEGRRCLVVGGGAVAARKVRSLLRCGARVRVVAPKLSDEMETLVREGGVEIFQEPFDTEHMEDAALVIAATDNEQVNRAVYGEAAERGVPVNVVDQPDLCTFIVPSVVRRGDLTIAVSTSGKSPAVAKRVRKLLESQFGDEWAAYLRLMGDAREKALKEIDDPKRREEIFNRLADSDLLEKLRYDDKEGARRLIEEIVGR